MESSVVEAEEWKWENSWMQTQVPMKMKTVNPSWALGFGAMDRRDFNAHG